MTGTRPPLTTNSELLVYMASDLADRIGADEMCTLVFSGRRYWRRNQGPRTLTTLRLLAFHFPVHDEPTLLGELLAND
jgi:hypothetical protein